MLRELHIRNFSIIDDISVEFEKGFNVITGETGAGKSIIIDALSLSLGERASGDIIRRGAKEAVIEAFIDISPEQLHPSTRKFLEDNGIDFDDGLILKRIISSQGKNRAYINGSISNLQSLAEISKNIVDIHGQYEHQSLLSPDKQLDMLDTYGKLFPERQEAERAYEMMIATRNRILDLTGKEKERAQRLDMLRFQVTEIDAAELKPGEDEELEKEAKILGSAVRLAELSNNAYEQLYSSESACITNLSQILKDIKDISDIDTRASDALKSAENSLPLLEETAYFLRDYKDSLDFDPDRLEQVQTQLELIKNLKRKYGNSIQEIIDYREKAVNELDDLQFSEDKIESLMTELNDLKTILTKKVHSLSKKRKKNAKKIEAEVIACLSELSMPNTEFSIQITFEKGDDTTDGLRVSHSGIDNVEFLISPNPGEDLKPLQKIISGGELSRVMLALKGILAGGDNIPILIFDEIDAGIGGKTADNVAGKLKDLSSSHQLICITHLPQIASPANRHLKIAKNIKKDRTFTEIRFIEKDERAAEVARMLGGNISDVSIKHAKELLKRAR
jgi:DNA repair protein RecN (Recombination protein N)